MNDDSLREGEVLPPGVSYMSTLTVSDAARTEANNLSDEKYIQPLKEIIETSKEKDIRAHAYNTLLRIANKNSNQEVGDFVMLHLDKEKDKYIIQRALLEFSWGNHSINTQAETLLRFSTHKAWQIRFHALGLLDRLAPVYKPRIEAICLTLAQQYRGRPHDAAAIAGALEMAGTLSAISCLKEMVSENSKSFAVNSALSAIAAINGKQELDYFISCLKDKKDAEVKSQLIQILCTHGNDQIVEILINRATTILAKPRKTKIIYTGNTKPELIHILIFLKQFNNYPSVLKFTHEVLDKKRKNLDETESNWVQTNM